MQLRLHIAITFRLGQCSILLWAPFRGADGQVINLAPIRAYLSVSAHARVWCWLTESNRRHPAYKAGALPAELNQLILKHPARAFLVYKLVSERQAFRQ